MNLIFLHGRSQQKKDPQELKQLWVDCFKSGLGKQGLTLPEDVKIIFPFYGDVLDGLANKIAEAANLEGVVAKGGSAKAVLNPLEYFEILNEFASQAGISTDEINAEYQGNHKERGPLNWEWVQAIVRALDKYDGVGQFSLKAFTADVSFYLNQPMARRKINEFITSCLDDEPTVFVAHSLGTVIAYDVLQKASGLDIKKFVTLGSPLGMRAIKAKLTAPLSKPKCVKGDWYNAYDERDFVALKPLNKDNFDIDPPIINTNHVSNHTKNRHGIEGYLDDTAIAKEIYDALA